MENSSKLEMNPRNCIATISGDSLLTEMSFCIETVASHFLGRKVSRFECKRTKLSNGDCQLDFSALKQSGPMVISKVMNIRNAVSQGYYPKFILDSECFLNEPGFSTTPFAASDGQHRHRGYNQKSDAITTSVVESDTNSEALLASLSYGLGDMLTGLFALNVKYVKWQGSLKKNQLYFKHDMSEQKLKSFLNSNQDYDLNRKIKTLT